MELIVLTKVSSTGHSKQVRKLYFDKDINPKCHAASVLLRNQLRSEDRDYMSDVKARIDRIEFSRSFLTEKLKQQGSLTCEYCGKRQLIIEYDGMKVPSNIKATIDHVVPISKSGRTEPNNLRVACSNCNNKKGNKDLDEFLKKYKQNEKSKTW